MSMRRPAENSRVGGGQVPKIAKFATVGACGTVVKLGLLYLLVEYGNVHYLGANALTFLVAVTHNYILNSLWTFRGREANPVGYFKYMVTSLFSLGINSSIVFVLTGPAGVWYMASAFIAIVAGFLINFTISGRWVWARPRERKLLSPPKAGTIPVEEIRRVVRLLPRRRATDGQSPG